MADVTVPQSRTRLPAGPADGGVLEYHGSVSYCYSDAIAMFLSAHGIDGVSPGLIEVLSGIALLGGARIPDTRGDKLYFSMTPNQVPARLNQAMDLLGCDYTATAGPAGADAVELLRADLRTGPVLLGPCDMGHLTYIPYHAYTGGADHYVVAYAIDADLVALHDPLGFPCARLNFTDLSKAWRARSIGADGGPFRRWLAPRGERRVAVDAALYRRAVDYLRTVQREVPPGDAVIRTFARDLRSGELAPSTLSFLSVFSFPVQARRGLDHAEFFRWGGDTGLAAIKQRQAQLFSDCHHASGRQDWTLVADRLEQLAELEPLVAGYRWVDPPAGTG
jgi:hypothetical protein